MNLNVHITDLKNKESTYSELLNNISSKNKLFNYSILDECYVVNYNNIDIGVIGIKNVSDNLVSISLYQTPKICRLSIITLIESSLYYAKNNVTTKTYCFENCYTYYNFIFQYKIKIYKEENNNIYIDKEILDNVKQEQITNKIIIIN